MTVFNFKIADLACQACIKLSMAALRAIPGIADVKIDLASGASTVTSSENTSWKQIESALRSVGKTAVKT